MKNKIFAIILGVAFCKSVAACELPDSIEKIGDIEAALKCLESRMSNLENERGNGNVDVVTQLGKKMTFSSQQSVEQSGIVFDVISCKKSRHVNCEIRITSLDSDLVFELDKNSKIFDESGFESTVKHANVGGVESRFPKYAEVHKRLISNIPTVVNLQFPLPNANSTAISAIRLVYELNDSKDIVVYVRNVSFSK
ncbi:hypothetical protein [Vibrio spartinae]|uniref:Uncharacterized protein n=1 Tax=Vibrio spartinae TaxID=1918945 RepID=A0A1N6MB43_9VIBR|nr:hypothetical protein [Vibrio spartinae]SIO96633.1 hypothetical protein VSP9026_04436 [Vibrio spartinae]